MNMIYSLKSSVNVINTLVSNCVSSVVARSGRVHTESYARRQLCVSTEQDTAVYLKTDDRYNIFILLTRSPDEMLCPDGLQNFSRPHSLPLDPLLGNIFLSVCPERPRCSPPTEVRCHAAFWKGQFRDTSQPTHFNDGREKEFTTHRETFLVKLLLIFLLLLYTVVHGNIQTPIEIVVYINLNSPRNRIIINSGDS